MQITIQISGRTAQAAQSPVIVCGNSDYVISFSFDSEWSAFFEKTALFQYCKRGSIVTEHVPFTGNACRLPAVQDTDEVLVGICAGDIRTAAPARIPCARAVTDYPSQQTAPVPDTFNRLMDFICQHTETEAEHA